MDVLTIDDDEDMDTEEILSFHSNVRENIVSNGIKLLKRLTETRKNSKHALCNLY